MEKPIIAQKKEEVAALASKIKNAETVIALDYLGLPVEDLTKLRNQLREAGCEIKVYKNNISRRAAIEAGYPEFAECFKGPKAIAMSSSDAVAPAKVVFEFGKTNPLVKIYSGVVQGKEATASQVEEIASLPSYEGLLTMLAGGMLQPLTQLAIGLNMITEKMAEA